MKRSKTTDEYATFEDALKTVLSVPREEMQRRENEYQRERAQLKDKNDRRSRKKTSSR